MRTREQFVLLVDDHEAVLRAFSRVLQRAGFRVTRAASAKAARAAGSHDIGIFDIALGSDSGIDLARELLESGRLRHAVFLTGSTEAQVLERASRIGPVVSKAKGAHALLDVLRSLG